MINIIYDIIFNIMNIAVRHRLSSEYQSIIIWSIFKATLPSGQAALQGAKAAETRIAEVVLME